MDHIVTHVEPNGIPVNGAISNDEGKPLALVMVFDEHLRTTQERGGPPGRQPSV